MIGAFTLGKKAVTFGYKRYGIPGAIASGGLALVGYVAVRRALRSASASDGDSIDAALDASTIKNAVEARGLEAVTDPQTLDEAIDPDELGSDVDTADLSSTVSDETDEITDGTDEESSADG
ncbi:hypothetical protein [Halosolutus gelatinilyticus]|uniref:hypothetical protein n=1 Tax=Halosolutus gelatinilyticus TaxID=2931975 RepID=UPI001FF1E552|nr:hypothetical protein [Halosolutus gelatinilyticus]